MWMNVDKPERKCTIHTDSCLYAKNKKESKFKGILEIKDHGGWLPFESISTAREYQQSDFPSFKLHLCDCN